MHTAAPNLTAAQFDLHLPPNTRQHFSQIFNTPFCDIFNSINHSNSYTFPSNQQVDLIITYQQNDLADCFLKLQNYQHQGFWAIGYVNYEAFNDLDSTADFDKPTIPLLYFKIFNAPNISIITENNLNHSIFNGFNPKIAWKTLDFKIFSQNIQMIQKKIHHGEVYQINYTHLFKQKLSTQFKKEKILNYYHALGFAQKYRYSCYLKMNDDFLNTPTDLNVDIISHSPELFFAWDGANIFTQPMKGTAKRNPNHHIDLLQKEYLQNSAKECAENIMIVDLLRNDLSQISEPHTLKVPQLLDCIDLPSVWQMVSGIQAKTKKNINLYDIFKALFPCGSITGAPKKAAISLIEQLEQQRRDIYCGAIGLVTPHGAVFNVAIRTLWLKGNVWHYGVGSGITIDSKIEQEWQEWQNKMRFLSI